MAPSRHDWKIVDWDVKPQHNQSFQEYGVFDIYVPLLVECTEYVLDVNNQISFH